jgi:hypothetical protein
MAMFESMMGGGTLSTEMKKRFDEQGEKPHRGGCWAAEFHAHGRFFLAYSVQLGTDKEQQWIHMFNNGGRIVVYAIRLP